MAAGLLVRSIDGHLPRRQLSGQSRHTEPTAVIGLRRSAVSRSADLGARHDGRPDR
jgi:hypothetical protein